MSWLRKDLRELVPYELHVQPHVVKLDANESPYDLPRPVKDKILRHLSSGLSFNRYPDPSAEALCLAISEYTGVAPQGILVGNGLDEVILTLMLAFAAGSEVVITPPTFTMYRVHSVIAGAKPVSVPRGKEFQLDLAAIQEAVKKPETKMIIITTPNNPTGNATKPEDIEAILKNRKKMVVVDEAYIDFGGQTCLHLLEKNPNLVVLRTFSKAFGLAGLRIGYLMAGPEVVNDLKRIKQPYNINTFSQVAALVALLHREEYFELVNEILSNRQFLLEGLKNIQGIEVFPTEANFILFRTDVDAGEVYNSLLEKGVLIRNVDGVGTENCLRVTVGKREENEYFLDKLKVALDRA